MRVERRKHIISQDRWMVSYADFITLLFALFVVLFAFAKADQKKQTQVSESIESAFKELGVFSGSNSASSKDHAAIAMNTVMGVAVCPTTAPSAGLGVASGNTPRELNPESMAADTCICFF